MNEELIIKFKDLLIELRDKLKIELDTSIFFNNNIQKVTQFISKYNTGEEFLDDILNLDVNLIIDILDFCCKDKYNSDQIKDYFCFLSIKDSIVFGNRISVIKDFFLSIFESIKNFIDDCEIISTRFINSKIKLCNKILGNIDGSRFFGEFERINDVHDLLEKDLDLSDKEIVDLFLMIIETNSDYLTKKVSKDIIEEKKRTEEQLDERNPIKISDQVISKLEEEIIPDTRNTEEGNPIDIEYVEIPTEKAVSSNKSNLSVLPTNPHIEESTLTLEKQKMKEDLLQNGEKQIEFIMEAHNKIDIIIENLNVSQTDKEKLNKDYVSKLTSGAFSLEDISISLVGAPYFYVISEYLLFKIGQLYDLDDNLYKNKEKSKDFYNLFQEEFSYFECIYKIFLQQFNKYEKNFYANYKTPDVMINDDFAVEVNEDKNEEFYLTKVIFYSKDGNTPIIDKTLKKADPAFQTEVVKIIKTIENTGKGVKISAGCYFAKKNNALVVYYTLDNGYYLVVDAYPTSDISKHIKVQFDSLISYSDISRINEIILENGDELGNLIVMTNNTFNSYDKQKVGVLA